MSGSRHLILGSGMGAKVNSQIHANPAAIQHDAQAGFLRLPQMYVQ
jgi:hypothetical protein